MSLVSIVLFFLYICNIQMQTQFKIYIYITILIAYIYNIIFSCNEIEMWRGIVTRIEAIVFMGISFLYL